MASAFVLVAVLGHYLIQLDYVMGLLYRLIRLIQLSAVFHWRWDL